MVYLFLQKWKRTTPVTDNLIAPADGRVLSIVVAVPDDLDLPAGEGTHLLSRTFDVHEQSTSLGEVVAMHHSSFSMPVWTRRLKRMSGRI